MVLHLNSVKISAVAEFVFASAASISKHVTSGLILNENFDRGLQSTYEDELINLRWGAKFSVTSILNTINPRIEREKSDLQRDRTREFQLYKRQPYYNNLE